MNEERARQILGDMVQSDNSLYDVGFYIDWHGRWCCIDCPDIGAEQLEAIAWWIKNMKVVG